MAEKINICIVHFNTPKLTECLVRSINKFTPNSTIYIFDNSNKRPFTAKFDNVIIINNTKGQYVNFDEWLKKYPNRRRSGGKLNLWGSAKHCYSVELCMNIIGDSFILLDSDILLKKDISPLFDNKYIYTGEVITQAKSTIKRVLPYICFINVPAAKKNNVHYFNENYMHGLAYTNTNKYADSYDTGAYFYLSSSKLPSLKIKWEDYCVHYGSGSWIKEKRSDKKKIATKLSENEFIEMHKNLWQNNDNTIMTKNKKVIYTCITGNYEPLDDPFVISPGYDYICFTNSPSIKSNIWKLRPIPKELDGLSEVKKQRCIKINAHKYLPEYDFSIWVDGSVKLKKDVNEFVNKNCKDAVVFIPTHPQRQCIYDEMNACIRMKKDTEANIKPQREKYLKENFPKHYGLVQSNIMMRCHNNPDCIRLMETWWQEVKNYSHRDQLSFDYARWKNPDVKFAFLDKNTCKSQYFMWDQTHGKKKSKSSIGSTSKTAPIPIERKPIIKPTVNKPVANTASQRPRIVVTPTMRRNALSKQLKRFLSAQ